MGRWERGVVWVWGGMGGWRGMSLGGGLRGVLGWERRGEVGGWGGLEDADVGVDADGVDRIVVSPSSSSESELPPR